MRIEESYPGKEIGVIEEYFPSIGTYTDTNGIIRSLFLGKTMKDIKTHKVEVYPIRKLKIINVGDIIMGRIINVSGVFGYVKIEAVDYKPLDREFNGIVYPHKLVNRVDSVYRVSDYILAKVVSKVNRSIHLSIEGEEYGVIYAKCSYCGMMMMKIGKNKLRCKKCDNIERRKLSKFYGEIIK